MAVIAWAASTAYSVGNIRRATTQQASGLVFKCTTAGTSASSQPAWPTDIDSTVTDSSTGSVDESILNAYREIYYDSVLSIRVTDHELDPHPERYILPLPMPVNLSLDVDAGSSIVPVVESLIHDKLDSQKNYFMEDAMMSYRIVRAPERRVFYIDVGNVAPQDVEQYMQKVMTQMKRNQVVDSSTGRVDLR